MLLPVRSVLVMLLVLISLFLSVSHAAETPSRPNVIVIFADDLGYGDLGCFGHPTIRTPHLDRMAAEGMKFTQFYSAAEVCTPSRAALLTGRLPIRSGMCSDRRRVLFPNSGGGLPQQEITLAEALKGQGYATCCVGKWHLGHLPQFLPTEHGFDEYFGIPYSNDMRPTPLLRGTETVEEPARQETLTQRYTEEVLGFIERHQQEPFFIYYAQTFPHIPLFASDDFRGTSRRGLYGDVVEELDASVGRILNRLRETGLDRRTLVVFCSDNGPWLTQKLHGGSAGLLRDGKGSTWEGGMREPTIAWWPGSVPAGTVTAELGCTMDLFTTALLLAGGTLPDDRDIDGVDLRPVLLKNGASPRDSMIYYRGARLMAVRHGAFKAHYVTQPGYGPGKPEIHDPPLLFNLEHDPSEQFNIADQHPDILAAIQQITTTHQATLKPVPSQLEIPLEE